MLFRSVEDVLIEEDEIIVKFVEDVRHDCPDCSYIGLTFEQLEMSDADWLEHINKLADEIVKQKQEEEQNEKQKIIKQKQELFQRLKVELGL